MKKLILAIAALAVASAFMAGCGAKTEEADTGAKGGNGKADTKEPAAE